MDSDISHSVQAELDALDARITALENQEETPEYPHVEPGDNEEEEEE